MAWASTKAASVTAEAVRKAKQEIRRLSRENPGAAIIVTGCAAQTAPPLPRLAIDPGRVAVVGVSSGAYMATQVHFAYSDRLAGAALVAGGPYGCAEGKLELALGPCMKAEPAAPDVARAVFDPPSRRA